MNIDNIKSIQKIASQAMSLIEKYTPEPEDEEDYNDEEDYDDEDEDYEDE